MVKIKLREDFIKLGQALKAAGLVESGVDAKFMINKKELLNCIDRATLLVKEGDKKPIIFRIPVSGERPITYSATLPEGLQLDGNIITGSVAEEGDYTVTLVADFEKVYWVS